MIYMIRGRQSKGKTALAVATVKELILFHGYNYSEVVANILLPNWPGSHSLSNHQMKAYVKSMVTKGLKHKIIILDEVDRLFPARMWHDADQTDALIGLWQDEKLFNHIITTSHIGTSTDIILMQCSQIELLPDYHKEWDSIEFTVINDLDGEVHQDGVDNVSERVFPDYDRWEVIV